MRNSNYRMPAKMEGFNRHQLPPARVVPVAMHQRYVGGNNSRYTRPPPQIRPDYRPPAPLSGPSIPKRPTNRFSDEGHTSDVQPAYLMFEQQEKTLCHGPPERSPGPMAAAKRPNVPLHILHDVRAMLPRIPMKPATRIPQNDHSLSFRFSDQDDIPTRAPPSPPQFQQSKKDEIQSRDSSHSASARHISTSLKDELSQLSHKPNRRFNNSTGSIGSMSSDQSASLSSRPSSDYTTRKFAMLRPINQAPTQFPESAPRMPLPGRLPPMERSMPSFETPPAPQPSSLPLNSANYSTSVEEQPWFFDGNRQEAQNLIDSCKRNGMFLVRPSTSKPPFALTIWANGSFYNLRIRKRDDAKYALGTPKSKEISYGNVVQLIEYHQQNEVNLADDEGSVMLTVPPLLPTS